MAELPDQRTLDLLDRQLGRYQEIVGRLATAAAQVKTWCVTDVAGLVAIAVGQQRPGLVLVGLVVLIPFAYLDAYYLAMERSFRRSSQELAKRVADERLDDWTELVQVEAPGGGGTWSSIVGCARSAAIWPFYLALALLLGAGALAV
jgi:hypothetical protein